MVLPARSVAVQLTALLPAVLATGVPQLDDARPDSPSAALGDAVAVPFSSTGFGDTIGASVGAVPSRLTVTVWVLVPPSLVALQLTTWPGVSELIVVGAHGAEVIADSSSVTDQFTVTSLVYHPSLPNGPSMWGATTGAVSSDGTDDWYAPAFFIILRLTPR